MFDLSWTHILIVLVVALLVVGPKDLPRMMHTVGRWVGKARNMADEFRKSFDDMTKQAELDELRQEIDALRRERPLASLANDMHQSILPPVDLPAPGTTPFVTGTAPQEAIEPKPAEDSPTEQTKAP